MEKRPLGRPPLKWEDKIKKEVEAVELITERIGYG